MTAQDLKNSILQLAVQGKLVPQDPNDEPASELLKKICAEKAKLLADGKIKREKPLSPVADNEIPFEIPDTWEWVRLGELANKFTDGTHRTPTYVEKGIPFISVKDMSSGYLDFTNTKHITQEEHDELFLRCNPEIGDLLISKVGTTGIPAIVDVDTPFSLFVSVALMKFPHDLLNVNWLYYLIYSPLVFNQAKLNTKGVGNQNWVIDKIRNTIIVLPPLAEQARIVAKIEELLPLVNEYDEAEKRLSELNAEFPDKLRKSILQQAVQGKLTERNPTDEPASELLKRIRAEKAKLVADGKGKADKPYVPITEDEMTFELPKGWSAIRIGELGFYRKGPFGSSLTKQMFVPKGSNSVKVYEQKNAIQKDCSLGDYYITRDYFESKMKGFEVFPGDIIVSCAGTIGESYVMPNGCERGIINQALMRMKIVDAMNLDYFLLYFDYVLKASAQKNSKGVAIKNIPPFEILKNMIMPLPPLAEQERIVARVRELLAVCDELKQSKGDIANEYPGA